VQIVAFLLIGAYAPAQTVPPRFVDRGQLMQDVRTLSAPSFEGRAAGSPGGVRAREWIVGRFKENGVRPGTAGGYLQPFTFTAGRNRVMAANVIGRLGEPRGDKALLITAHYDHLGIRNGVLYPGADDNASGVAALLAAAKHFAAHPPRHEMVFVATDAEEIGLRGARALLDMKLIAPRQIALLVNLDMVSKNSADEIYAAGTAYSPWLRPLLTEVGARSSVKLRFGHDRPPATANGPDDWTQESDHGPFHAAGTPFVYFGVEDHPDYHKPSDTADRIDPGFFGDVADLIVDALTTFDAAID
jgi:Zn-dependent M28 family amino/carboxypeptidase